MPMSEQVPIETDDDIAKGEVFHEIVRRFGNPATYEPGEMKMMHGMKM